MYISKSKIDVLFVVPIDVGYSKGIEEHLNLRSDFVRSNDPLVLGLYGLQIEVAGKECYSQQDQQPQYKFFDHASKI